MNIIEQARQKLLPLIRGFDPEPACWIDGGDEGFEYCRECAEVKAAENEEWAAWGGYLTHYDTPPYCETCGKFLDYELTGEGVNQAIYHFLNYDFMLNTETAYELITMIDCADETHTDDIEKIAERIIRSKPCQEI